MKSILWAAIVALATAGGCVSYRDSRAGGDPHAPGAWAEVHQSPVSKDVLISAASPIVLHGWHQVDEDAKTRQCNYYAILMPTPWDAVAHATPRASAPTLDMTDGFAYLTGGWPILVSSTYVAQAEGTRIGALTVRPAAGLPFERVFLFRPTPGQVLRIRLKGPVSSGPDELVITNRTKSLFVEVMKNGAGGVAFGKTVEQTDWDPQTTGVVDAMDSFRRSQGLP